jgi:hypothetical protein
MVRLYLRIFRSIVYYGDPGSRYGSPRGYLGGSTYALLSLVFAFHLVFLYESQHFHIPELQAPPLLQQMWDIRDGNRTEIVR